MEIVMDIDQKEFELQGFTVAPSIFLNKVFKIMKKHLEQDVKMAVLKRTWREILITLEPLPGKTNDYVRTKAENFCKEINDVYDAEPSVRAYVRYWGSNNVEIYLSFRG